MTVETLTAVENLSIRGFVESCHEWFMGDVLDYGCGKQPYREIVEAAGGVYYGFDRKSFPANMSRADIGIGIGLRNWDAILCTQVIQFTTEPDGFLAHLKRMLGETGTLVMTYPTNWPEVNDTDLHRFTEAGMKMMLERQGFNVVRSQQRASWVVDDYELAYGYGVVAVVS